jgi:hypothetical protein
MNCEKLKVGDRFLDPTQKFIGVVSEIEGFYITYHWYYVLTGKPFYQPIKINVHFLNEASPSWIPLSSLLEELL